MDRVFHARVGAARYLALLMFTFMLVYCLWVKYILIAVLWSILLLHFIERIIHTTYTLTADGRLVVYEGRFSRRHERSLAEVVSVERRSSMQVAGRALVRYVLVVYKDGRHDALQPVNEAEFVRVLEKRKRETAS
ncbi:PH domain-containing protein [Mediterranea massiliensis]|uniref:PH domain-containing protein n=1 Tax=Mediterranea massiliensis TaxID=1841865 RepID=UPI0023F1754E|nr:PH domain-containing protein [Mediterranea massiliensis]